MSFMQFVHPCILEAVTTQFTKCHCVPHTEHIACGCVRRIQPSGTVNTKSLVNIFSFGGGKFQCSVVSLGVCGPQHKR